MDLDAENFRRVAPLDWGRLARAHQFYADKGYTYVEVPWAVPRSIVDITLPPEAQPMATGIDEAILIGSAEQGFLDIMYTECRLRPGILYFSITPCFRGEPQVIRGETQMTFMKVELFSAEAMPAFPEERAEMSVLLMQDAHQFMAAEGAFLSVVETAEGKDLFCAGLEVGSYGTRSWNNYRWAYGTGLAEPRFSTAVTAYERRRRGFLHRRTKL